MKLSIKAISLLIIFNSYVVQAKNNIVGLWLLDDNQTVVNIIECNRTLCGKIEGFNTTKETEKDSTEDIEKEIGNEFQKISNVCNTNIIGGFTKDNDKYKDGWIKDFESKKVYSADIKLIDKEKIEVLAYLGMRLFGETMVWNKVEKIDLSCDEILERNNKSKSYE